MFMRQSRSMQLYRATLLHTLSQQNCARKLQVSHQSKSII